MYVTLVCYSPLIFCMSLYSFFLFSCFVNKVVRVRHLFADFLWQPKTLLAYSLSSLLTPLTSFRVNCMSSLF